MKSRKFRSPAEVLAPRLVQFLAVADCENVSRAAAKLGMGQPALSRAMARLESDLGLALFTRQGRTLRLTPAGHELAKRLSPSLEQLDSQVLELVEAAAPGQGRARIGFLKSMVEEVAPTMLAAFHNAHPDLRVTMMVGSSRELATALLHGELDLAMMAPAPTDPGIESTVLDAQPLAIEVPTWHPLAGEPQVSFTALSEEKFLTMTSEYGTRQLFDALCTVAGFTPSIVFETDDIRTIRALVASGAGIALLPRASHPHPDIVALDVVEPAAVREFCLCWHTAAVPGESVRLLKSFLQNQRGRILD